MVVEDDESIRSLVHQILESMGYTVFSAGSPHEALEPTADLPGTIHLLVTDVIMPGMTGKDLAGRPAEIYPDMKCLYMSGYTFDIISGQGALKENVHFIAKPFTIDDIECKVREVLDG
ncbi:response regulator [Desulfoplanes sp.]